MDIDVMDYIALMKRGDLEGAARKSFDCVMCGLCAAVCEVQIKPHRVGIYARRITGAFYPKKPAALLNRISEIAAGKYDAEWDRVLSSNPEELASLEV